MESKTGIDNVPLVMEHKVDSKNKDIIFILCDDEIDFIIEITKNIKNEKIKEIFNNIISKKDSTPDILFNMKDYIMLYKLIIQNDDILNEKKIEYKINIKEKKIIIDIFKKLE